MGDYYRRLVIGFMYYLSIRSNHNLRKTRNSPCAWSSNMVFFSSRGKGVNTRLPMDPSPVNFFVILVVVMVVVMVS